MPIRSRGRRVAAPTALLALVALLAAAAVTQANGGGAPRERPPALTVMTRNIYLGGDISLPIGSSTRAEFERRNTEVWRQVVRTNFPARARLLAREIDRTGPDLIGLQEVALWRRGPKDDPAPARRVAYDFLSRLLKALRSRGLHYSIGRVQREADVEGPTSLGFDARLTMRDVILVKRRRDLKVVGRRSARFRTRLSVPTPVGTVVVWRGWTAVDVALRGRRLRFVNTHLEAFGDAIRLAQARELVARGGPTRTRLPVILVGDLNSDPTGAAGSVPAAYRTLIGAGFRDTWRQIHPFRRGWSCCMRRPDLSDPPPAPFDHRIDHTLTKPRLRGLRATIVGGDPRNRTRSGLWPADHGGVATRLRLR